MQTQKGSSDPHSVYSLSSSYTVYRRYKNSVSSNKPMDVPVKEGFLQKAHPKDGLFSVTIWQKRYFVLWSTGTVEYYTNYNKKADEYCGTLNLVDCEDMVAPITVGKRHNVIKLTMKQKDRLKDYWLDCECPPLMNEWVKLLATASGLVPEEGVPAPSSFEQSLNLSESAVHSTLLDRPLPPTPVKCDAEYEIPTRSSSLDSDPISAEENYEEIGSTTSTDSMSDWEPVVPPKRYSKAASIKRYTANIEEMISAQGLLKKPVLPNHGSDAPNSPTRPSSDMSNSQSFSPPLATNVPVLTSVPPRPTEKIKKYGHNQHVNPLGNADTSELLQRISHRREEICTSSQPLSPTEVYEEVQFSEEVKVGCPTNHRRKNSKKVQPQQSASEDSQGYVDVDKADSDDDDQQPSYLAVDHPEDEVERSFPKTPPPILPPRERRQFSPSSVLSSQVSSSVPPLPSRLHSSQESSPRGSGPVLPTRGDRKILPPTPAAELKASLPPPPPHRNHSLEVSSHIAGTSDSESDSPPPIPQRRGGGRTTPTDGIKPKPAPKRKQPLSRTRSTSPGHTEFSLDRSQVDSSVNRHPVTSSAPSTYAPASGRYPLPSPSSGFQSEVGHPPTPVAKMVKGGASNKPKPSPPTRQKPKPGAQQAVGGITNKPVPPIPTKRTGQQLASDSREGTHTPPPPTTASLFKGPNHSQQRSSIHRLPSSSVSESTISSAPSPASRRPPAILPKPVQTRQVSQPILGCRPLSETEMMTVNHTSSIPQAAKSTNFLINGQSNRDTPVTHSHRTSNDRPTVKKQRPPMPPPKPR